MPDRHRARVRIRIDWTHVTPLASLGDGILIGMAAAVLLANGRAAGSSGMTGSLLRPERGDIG
jgi:hypothetical protein